MLNLITGGSGSGKSVLAENAALKLYNLLNADSLTYIATMRPYGDEALRRISRHRRQRAGKGFTTIECCCNLKAVKAFGGIVLLECLSNLAANELFECGNTNAYGDILDGIDRLCSSSKAVIAVTNEIFSDGINYDDDTIKYISLLGRLNIALANRADNVCEAVCGIPVKIKAGEYYAF